MRRAGGARRTRRPRRTGGARRTRTSRRGYAHFSPFSPLPFIYLQLISILIRIVILICRSTRRARRGRRREFGIVDQLVSHLCPQMKMKNLRCIWLRTGKWLLDLLVHSWTLGHIR